MPALYFMASTKWQIEHFWVLVNQPLPGMIWSINRDLIHLLVLAVEEGSKASSSCSCKITSRPKHFSRLMVSLKLISPNPKLVNKQELNLLLMFRSEANLHNKRPISWLKLYRGNQDQHLQQLRNSLCRITRVKCGKTFIMNRVRTTLSRIHLKKWTRANLGLRQRICWIQIPCKDNIIIIAAML